MLTIEQWRDLASGKTPITIESARDARSWMTGIVKLLHPDVFSDGEGGGPNDVRLQALGFRFMHLAADPYDQAKVTFDRTEAMATLRAIEKWKPKRG